ncbi:histone-lysine N-methyltransferase SETMAR [Numida meleagris]|uniref:histone-lysine N-methyltransferase SETMAR n=1 Tax=Numida meleagris TaxID=8996 RepID=UPI000B3E1FD8|nr:histone-lysine N-methyltransferase SETMAR [Numida meleagris]
MRLRGARSPPPMAERPRPGQPIAAGRGCAMAAGRDVSGGLEPVPVALWPPGESPPPFQYSPDSVPGTDGAVDPTEVTFPGCPCRSRSCSARSCSCLRHGERYRASRILPRAGPLFECNAMCRCGDSCRNRVVQRGLQVRLEVFKTAEKGWGVRALEPIAEGRFVCEYAGEVLGFEEARRRIRAQTAQDSNYIIAVREHLHSGQVMETFVDPTYTGNVGRFLNHSCEPNLFMVPVRVDSMVPKLALFAATDIAAGEELCYDYSGRFRNAPPTEGQQKASGEGDVLRKPCFCGSRTCAAFLPWDGSLFPAADACSESSP